MLKFISLFTALFCFGFFGSGARANVEWVNFTFQFGAATLDAKGESFHGSGWSATTEIYTLRRQQGYLLNVGSSSVSGDDGAFFDKRFETLNIDNRYIQAGAFFYPLQGFRVAAGPSFNRIEREVEYNDGSKVDDTTGFAGPFFNLSYRLPLETAVLGAQFNFVDFGPYAQSDLFLLVGIAF